MTTQSPFMKQLIIPISTNNLETIISQANIHIVNINYLLKSAKFKILADFICSNNKGVIITTNKATVVSNLNIIEKYVKGIDNIDSEDISSSCLF